MRIRNDDWVVLLASNGKWMVRYPKTGVYITSVYDTEEEAQRSARELNFESKIQSLYVHLS